MRDLQKHLSAMPQDLQWLATDLIREITDPKFINSRHGERHTRNRGCLGPMCKKSLRDWQRERARILAAMAGRTVRPHSRSSVYVRMDPFISAVKASHDEEYACRSRSPAELQTVGDRVA